MVKEAVRFLEYSNLKILSMYIPRLLYYLLFIDVSCILLGVNVGKGNIFASSVLKIRQFTNIKMKN